MKQRCFPYIILLMTFKNVSNHYLGERDGVTCDIVPQHSAYSLGSTV
jgi:ABC-type methionine transport system permease subunit